MEQRGNGRVLARHGERSLRQAWGIDWVLVIGLKLWPVHLTPRPRALAKPLARPRVCVPLPLAVVAAPLAEGSRDWRDAAVVVRVCGLEDAGGFSTKDVSVVL